MTELEQTIGRIHEEILKNRTEIKNYIEASETRLLMKIEKLKNTVFNLEKENKNLKEEIEYIKRSQKKKNILIFGLNKKKEEVTAGNLCEDLKNLLSVDLKESDFSDVYPLGKSESCPIKVEFNSHFKKKEVLKNCNKLKGRNISISHDLTQTQRSEIRILRKHLFLAKNEGKYKECYIRGSKLIVDGTGYAIEDLEKEENLETKPNSAPTTPIVEITGKKNPVTKKDPSTPKVPTAKKPVQLNQVQKPVQEKPRTRSIHK